MRLRINFDVSINQSLSNSSHAHEHIDGASCYIDVGSSYPGCAEAAKGVGVHQLKGIVSWVQNAVRQFV